jgi:hypothetical protein
MRLLFETHHACCMILPALFHVEHRCDNAECGAVHGWSLELGWLYWSVTLERTYPEDGTP